MQESGTNYLQLKISPASTQQTILITPAEMESLSSGQFSLLENLTIDLNVSAISYLYEIDATATEQIYSGSVQTWCGSVFDTCGNCGGMPAGTFKWCNGAYPLHTYSCDNWCYTFSPASSYEKAQVGNFIRQKAKAGIIILKGSTTTLSLDDVQPSLAQPNAMASLVFPSLSVPSQNSPLIRQTGSEKWRQITSAALQSYKSQLSAYYSQYTSSIDSAYSQTNSLNSQLSALLSSSSGVEYSNYFEYAPPESALPEILLEIEATYAGVSAIRGVPKAILLHPQASFENGNAYFSFDAQNTGAVSDIFSANLSCNDTIISNIENVLLAPSESAALKFFTPQILVPTICTAQIFILDSPSIISSASNTLEPFKLACPADKPCCAYSLQYEDRACSDVEKFKQEGLPGSGNYYLQHYSCADFICIESSTTFLRSASATPAPQAQLFSGNSNSNYYSANAPQIPQLANAPQNANSISPTPAISVFPNSTIVPSPIAMPIEEETIEIIAPTQIPQGYAMLSVRANNKPAEGSILLISPSMKRRTIPLELGEAEVLFNEAGVWKASYSFEYKKISVLPQITNDAKPVNSPPPNAATSFISLNISKMPIPESALLLVFFALGFAAYRRASVKVHFKKSFENNIVRLEILNNKADLSNLEITDIAPEGTILSTISNPPSEVTEIIFGKHIKWKKSSLRKGERMLISYSIFTASPQGSLRPAEILADAGNSKIRVLSNAVEA